jgi:signal transduction histidine kinase
LGAESFLQVFLLPPGDQIYFLLNFVLLLALVLMALGQSLRMPTAHAPAVYTIGAGAAVIAWVLLLVGALVALLTGQPQQAMLPPVEALAQALAVIWLTYAFVTANNPHRGGLPRTLTLGATAVLFVGYILTVAAWAGTSGDAFALSAYGTLWTLAALGLSAAGIAIIAVNLQTVVDGPLKMVALGLMAVTSGLALLGAGPFGDAAGIVRIGFTAFLVVSLGVVYRMVMRQMLAASASGASAVHAPASAPDAAEHTSRPGERDQAQLMRALGMMLENATPTVIPQRIAAAAANSLRTDVALLLSTHDTQYADITTGQDRVMNREITGISINLSEQATLANAIERRALRSLIPYRSEDELKDLYSRIDIEPVGPTYFQPLVSQGTLYGVLVTGNPYSGRELDDSEQELLKGIAIIGANLMALSLAARDARMEGEGRIIGAMVMGMPAAEQQEDSLKVWNDMRADLEAAHGQIAQLSQQVTLLKLELDDERSRMALALDESDEGKTISQRMAAVTEEQQRLAEDRDRLAARLREAETALAGASAEDSAAVFRAMIEVLERERVELTQQRERLQEELDELRAGGTAQPALVQDMLQRMSEEKARLQIERDQLSGKLGDIEMQLSALGVQGGAVGLTQLISQLFEQRASLQTRNESLRMERDALLNERVSLENRGMGIGDLQLAQLQTDLTHVANDREAAIKQRDRYRAERDELAARIESLKDVQAQLMAEATAFEQELTESHAELQELREQLRRLADDRSALMSERDALLAARQGSALERDQLMARVEGDRDRVHQLGVDGVGALTRMIEDLSNERGALERELNEVRNRLAAAENQLDMAQIKGMSKSAQGVLKQDSPDVLLSMVQDVRTPMTSIVGYVDLLLGESAGILGEMQRKFLQRISTNVQRLTSMLDDLIHVAFLDAGRFTLSPSPVNMTTLIEDSIDGAMNALREKELSLHLNLQDDVPEIPADRDALAQVVGHLLTNAYLVSPPGADLYISARQETVNEQADDGSVTPVPAVLVSFEDRGGGIALEDQPRVFARKYKAENPLVQGLGDTGVGLAIARALVEAHGGQIWLDTREGMGSTFSFYIPAQPVLATES